MVKGSCGGRGEPISIDYNELDGLKIDFYSPRV